jgi:AraC-like DNA-binding protein
MNLRTRIPAPPLSSFVDKFWLYEGPALPHARERLLPTGTVEMVLNLRENQTRLYDQHDLARPLIFPGAIVCGPHAKYFVIDTDEQVSVAGIHFRAGGAFPFFQCPIGELQDQHMALEWLWGPRAAAELRERLLAGADDQTRFAVMERFLLARLVRPLERRPSVAFALRQLHGAPQVQRIADLSLQTGLSARRFIELFRQEVGLAPKLFCRVRRFQHVLSTITSGGQFRWAHVAADCGYYDQSHFIHDFRTFAGMNPTEYPTTLGERRNHVPILG